jgi:hypothetical protein
LAAKEILDLLFQSTPFKGYEIVFKHLYMNNVLTPSRVRVWRAKLKETVINSVKYA